MEPVLAKAFAGFKVVAVSAHQIGFSAFLAIGVCWRFRGRKYAIEQDTNKCWLITSCRSANNIMPITIFLPAFIASFFYSA